MSRLQSVSFNLVLILSRLPLPNVFSLDGLFVEVIFVEVIFVEVIFVEVFDHASFLLPSREAYESHFDFSFLLEIRNTFSSYP